MKAIGTREKIAQKFIPKIIQNCAHSRNRTEDLLITSKESYE
jgi:hypothetical protein